MDDVFSGIRRLFWNAGESRLRALFRVPVVFLLVLLTAQLVTAGLGGFEQLFDVPSPLFTSLQFGALAVALSAVAWFIDKRRRRDMGLALNREWWLDAVAGLLTGLGMVATVVVALRLAGMATLGAADSVADPAIVLGDSALEALVYGGLFFTAVAVFEELVVRGYLLTNVAEGVSGRAGDERTAVWIAILGTAVIFGALHAANPGGSLVSFLNITLAGILLGVAYAATGRLGFPAGLHTTWNFGLGPLFGLPVSGLRTDATVVPVRVEGPRLVTGGEFGPEGGLVMVVALAVGTGLLAWWLQQTGDGLAVDEHVAIPDLWSEDRDST